MIPTGTVVDFSTRRATAPPPGPRSVAFIAETMARDTGVVHDPHAEPPPLAIRLDALCGVDDATVSRLAHIVKAGNLTGESAARLAIRHAEEIGRLDRRRRRILPPGPTARFEISVSGDLFDDHATRVARAAGGPWVCAAPGEAVERLLSAFPARGFDVGILVSGDKQRPSVRILAQVGWRRILVQRMGRRETDAIRHLVVVGGLPEDPYDRISVVAGMREAIRRARASRSSKPSGRPATPLPIPVLRILPLIELALPGLVSPR